MLGSMNIMILLALSAFIFYIWLFIYLRQHNHRLYVILISCLLLHLVLLSVIQGVMNTNPDPRRTWFGNDGEYYSMHARVIGAILTDRPASYISGLETVNPWVYEYTKRGMVPYIKTYQVGFITYIYGVLFAVFGYHPLVLNLINIIFHLFSGILIFKIGREIFDDSTGYIASIIFLFNPILLYYTTIKVAESLYIFFLCLIIFMSLSLFNKLNLRTIFLKFAILIVSLAVFNLFKHVLFFPLLFSILVYFIVLGAIRIKKIKALAYIMLMLVILYHQKMINLFNQIFYALATTHKTYLASGGQTYSLLNYGNDFMAYSFIQKLSYIFSSWMHFIIEPTRYSSTLYALYYPFKMAFIALFIISVMGLINALRARKVKSLLLIFILFIVGTVIAAASGNSGTMLRHRDTVTLIVFIFAAYYITGIINKFKRANETT